MVAKDSFTRGMEATREKIVRLGGCWGLLGVEGVEVPGVADIVEEEEATVVVGRKEREENGIFVRGAGLAAVLSG